MFKIILYICVLFFSLTGCYDRTQQVSGYIESKPLHIATQGSGKIVKMPLVRGQHVKRGDILFALEDTSQQDNLVFFQSQLAQAEADLANTIRGADPESIQQASQAENQAKYELDLARRNYERLLTLKKDQFVSPSELDKFHTAASVAQAVYEQASSHRQLLQKPARNEIVMIKRAQVDMMRARVRQAEWTLSQQQVKADDDGVVSDIYYRIYEDLAPNKPVLAMQNANKKDIVFYLPFHLLSTHPVGSLIEVACPMCAQNGAQAKITYISDQAEFTPPVVYSAAVNDKYVFYAKASFLDPKEQALFRFGQPLEITLSTSSSRKAEHMDTSK